MNGDWGRELWLCVALTTLEDETHRVILMHDRLVLSLDRDWGRELWLCAALVALSDQRMIFSALP